MDPDRRINKWQLAAICICFCLMTHIASFTLGVQPVYVVRLGADPATTGLYLAFNFFCVTVGNIAGGWLTDRIGQRRRITLISYALWIPAALLMTQATTVTGVILTSGLMWLPGGFAIAALSGIMGLSAGEHERGRVFGWVAMAGSLGGLLAGLIGGPLAEQFGFKALFIYMAAVAGVMFLVTLTIRDVTSTALQPHSESKAAPAVKAGIGGMVMLLVIANLVARVGTAPSDLGRPIIMLRLGLDTIAISNAIAVSSAVTLPLPLLMGWLSDRIGRKGLLLLCFGVGSLGVLILIVANAPWQFWLSAAMGSIINASGGVSQAYIADLTEPKMIGQSLSYLNSGNFIAGMIGLGGAGYVMQALGINMALVLGACLPVIGIILLLRIRPAAPKLVVDMVEAAV